MQLLAAPQPDQPHDDDPQERETPGEAASESVMHSLSTALLASVLNNDEWPGKRPEETVILLIHQNFPVP